MVEIPILALSFLIVLSVHEAAHALVADKLGDPNPRISGRLTLNPLAHIDPVGTVVLPLFLIFSGSPVIFGWAKPVAIDIFNLKNRRRDLGLVSLAGPAANFLFAVIFSLILRLVNFSLILTPSIGVLFLFSLVTTSVSLAVFNLLPIHPLDGGKALVGFLPSLQARRVDQFLHQYGQIILLFLIFPFFGSSLINQIISPIVGLILGLLLPFPSMT